MARNVCETAEDTLPMPRKDSVTFDVLCRGSKLPACCLFRSAADVALSTARGLDHVVEDEHPVALRRRGHRHRQQVWALTAESSSVEGRCYKKYSLWSWWSWLRWKLKMNSTRIDQLVLEAVVVAAVVVVLVVPAEPREGGEAHE